MNIKLLKEMVPGQWRKQKIFMGELHSVAYCVICMGVGTFFKVVGGHKCTSKTI